MMPKVVHSFHEPEDAVDVENGTVDTAVDVVTKEDHGEEALHLSESDGNKGSRMLLYFTTFSRFAVASFLTSAGCHVIPAVYLDTPTQDFKYASIFFILATGLLIVNAMIDFFQARGVVARTNAFLHILAPAVLEAGSISLYPGINKSGQPLAQYFFLVGTTIVCVAVFGDIGRLLHRGSAVSIASIVSQFSVIVGAVNFNYGTAFLMPEYLTSDPAIAKGGRFFVAGGVCFFVNAFATLRDKFF
mmetsp:Transcript_9084/g.19020  ORF Transcript_9084/g.19020 Transcript_9084/m.19020 type:complete len:245 (-) Transcript_9084:292-1026(-)